MLAQHELSTPRFVTSLQRKAKILLRWVRNLCRPLWEPRVALAEARERVAWHEAMDSGAPPSERQQVPDVHSTDSDLHNNTHRTVLAF